MSNINYIVGFSQYLDTNKYISDNTIIIHYSDGTTCATSTNFEDYDYDYWAEVDLLWDLGYDFKYDFYDEIYFQLSNKI